MGAVVLGNICLDILCYPVEDVPRYESIAFKLPVVAPGGCGSNVAIGLSVLGIPTVLVGRIGKDEAAHLIEQTWDHVGLDYRYVEHDPNMPTAVSVVLLDSNSQPRFIHTPGANALLSAADLNIQKYADEGASVLHIAGYFVLPGLLDDRLQVPLQQARRRGILTSLDVVRSPKMTSPDCLWSCMPYLDIFLCNDREAWLLSGEQDYIQAAKRLRSYGTSIVIVKLGAQGCWVESENLSQQVPGAPVNVVDTTGAGDAFAAGLIAALLDDSDLINACQAANSAGARIATEFGCISAWMD